MDNNNTCIFPLLRSCAFLFFLPQPHTSRSHTMASADVVAQLEATYPNLLVLKSRALATLQIKLRDVQSSHAQFKHYADRLMRCVAL